jgi:hypothetical protein
MFDINAPENSPANNPDVQEALSRRYSDDIALILPLKSCKLAIFNNARELCGIITKSELFKIWEVWYPPKPAPTAAKPSVNLEDLELL